MQNPIHSSDSPSLSQLVSLANSPAGQQLLKMLRENNEEAMRQAMSHVAQGDIRSAKQAIGSLLEDPEAQKLLSQLGR